MTDLPQPSKFHTTLEDHERAKEQWGLPQASHKRSAVDPDWLQQFIQQNGPYLHHAADPDAVEAIQRDGLIPHSQLPTGNKYAAHPELTPRPNNVYASTHRIMTPQRPHFRIDMRKLDPDKFNPDEDAMVEDRRRFGMQSPDEFKSRGEWADAYNLGADPRQTAYSLASLGRMAYQGGIPPEALELENVDNIPDESERPKSPAILDEHFPELQASSPDTRYRNGPPVFPAIQPPNPPQPTTQPTTQPQPTFSHIFNTSAPPPKSQKLGSTTLEWAETHEGAILHVTGGTLEDRDLGRIILQSELTQAGIELASFPMDHDPNESLGEELAKLAGMPKKADWSDVMQKAQQAMPNVQLLRNGYNNVVAQVPSESNPGDTHQVEFQRQDPTSQVISSWSCDCPWGSTFAWGTTRDRKKFEGRSCHHCLAAYWASLGHPLDEETDPSVQHVPPGTLPGQGEPGGGAGMGPKGETQPSLPGMQTPVGQPPGIAPGDQGSLFQQAWERSPAVQNALQNLNMQAQQPQDAGVIPPNPMPEEQAAQGQPGGPGELPPGHGQPNMVSVPGARPITPTNPIQLPSTWSKKKTNWQLDNSPYSQRMADDANETGQPQNSQFSNGDMVRLEEPTYGVAQGKSEAHGAGSWMQVAENSIGEVLSQDPTTGFLEAHFPLSGGAMTPYSVRMFLDPSQVSPSNVQKPGPFVNRH